MTTPRPALGAVMVLASGALFAINGTASKLVLRAGITPPQLTLIRAVGAFLGLLLLSLLLRPGARRLRATPHQVPVLVAFGLTGFFLVPMLYFVSITRMPVGIALLFEYTAPLLVALWARFGQRQTVRPRLWVGLALSLLGLGCVAEIWGRFSLDGIGVLAGLGAAVLLAGYYLLGAHTVRDRDTVSLCTWAFGTSAVAGLVVRAANGVGDWTPLTGTSGGVPVPLLVAYVVLLGSIAPFLLVAGAMRHLPATSVGIIGMVEPALAAVVARLVLGTSESLTPTQLWGGALVLAGVVLAETARMPAPATSIAGATPTGTTPTGTTPTGTTPTGTTPTDDRAPVTTPLGSTVGSATRALAEVHPLVTAPAPAADEPGEVPATPWPLPVAA